MNAVHLLGRLVEAPELKHTFGESKAFCRFRIAVARGKDKTDFFSIVAWEKTAEFAAQYFQKGERIIVHGSIRNADYVDKNGVKHYASEISADKLEFVETKASKEAANSSRENISETPPPPEPPPASFDYQEYPN